MNRCFALVIVSLLVGFGGSYLYSESKCRDYSGFMFSLDRKEKIISSINLLNMLDDSRFNDMELQIKRQLENAIISTKSLPKQYLALIEKDASISISDSSIVREMYFAKDEDHTLEVLRQKLIMQSRK